jgi:hypothetical protein
MYMKSGYFKSILAECSFQDFKTVMHHVLVNCILILNTGKIVLFTRDI